MNDSQKFRYQVSFRMECETRSVLDMKELEVGRWLEVAARGNRRETRFVVRNSATRVHLRPSLLRNPRTLKLADAGRFFSLNHWRKKQQCLFYVN